jgi:hypothetical protein
MKKGEVKSFRCGDILCLKWMDRKEVLMLSTQHNNRMTRVAVRAPGGRKEKDKPQCIETYNQNMAGIDLSDQMINYYAFNRKTLKWWKKHFFHLFNLALVNSYTLLNFLMKAEGMERLRMKDFLLQIAMGFVHKAGVDVEDVVLNQPMRTPVNRLEGRHFPSYNPPTEKRQRPLRACKVCKDKAEYRRKRENRAKENDKRKETSY